MELITELQNLNDRIYKLVKILKRKQENEELLTVQGLLLEEIADEMRRLLSNEYLTQNGEEKVIIVDRRKVDYSVDPYKEEE